MTTEPLLHATTAARLQRLRQQPPHGLLLTGHQGSGKTSVAQWLLAQILGLPIDALATYPYLHVIEPVNRSIGVEAVRSLEHFLTLKTASTINGVRRAVIIQDAQNLTIEAQNALLKTLEEPPADTMIILTADRVDSLLPTVRSRLQAIEVTKPLASDVYELLVARGASSTEANRIMAVSGGLPGLALAMYEGDVSHPLTQAAITARELVQQSTFERLAQIDKLSKDREQARNIVFILMQMAHAALLTGRGATRWQKVLQASYEAERALESSVQPKLALTNLMLNL